MDIKELFIQFHYPELKNLLLNILTLSYSIFTFSVVFAEKFIEKENKKNRGRISLFSAWIFFICSLIIGGIALVRLVIAGDFAHGGQIISRGNFYWGHINSIEQHLIDVYSFSFVAGVCFVTALSLLAVSAFYKLFKKK